MSAQAAMGTVLRAAGQERPVWDGWLLSCTFALLGLGLIMVYSASISSAERLTGNGGHYFWRHAAHIGLGVLVMVMVMYSRIRQWQSAGPYLLLIGIALLALLLVPGLGTEVNGSTRWMRLGVVNLQPSEFVKLFMVVYAAGYLVRKQESLRRFVPGILMIGLVVAVIGMLLLQEPDLGTVVVICLTVMTMMFLAGVRFWHFLLVLGAGIGGMAMLTLLSPYRLERVTGFLDPWADPFNSGFQLVQALIAFGRGEWFGVGLGSSIQKLSYLPAAHTDFILAVLAEEMGLVGVLAVMALFAVLVVRGFIIARQAEQAGELYAARLAQGITMLFACQAMINMGVNMGVLPTKGLTLPLMSYGGSSMVVSCAAIGILLMIGRQARKQQWGCD